MKKSNRFPIIVLVLSPSVLRVKHRHLSFNQPSRFSDADSRDGLAVLPPPVQQMNINEALASSTLITRERSLLSTPSKSVTQSDSENSKRKLSWKETEYRSAEDRDWIIIETAPTPPNNRNPILKSSKTTLSSSTTTVTPTKLIKSPSKRIKLSRSSPVASIEAVSEYIFIESSPKSIRAPILREIISKSNPRKYEPVNYHYPTQSLPEIKKIRRKVTQIDLMIPTRFLSRDLFYDQLKEYDNNDDIYNSEVIPRLKSKKVSNQKWKKIFNCCRGKRKEAWIVL